MCQYSAKNGCPTKWHYQHLASFSNSGVGGIMIESTAVNKVGKITHKDLAIYSKNQIKELKKLVVFLKTINKAMPIGIQIAHSGRSQASEMLYGVVGSNKDTRDWQSIMTSENILKEAQKETGNMYDPEVNIISSVDTNGVLNKQIAVLKDKNGIILRSISSDTTIAEETLNNFGVKRGAIPTNLEDQVDPDIFGSSLTLSYYYKGSTSKWNYMSGRFDSHQVNELDECLITSDKIFYNYGGVELN